MWYNNDIDEENKQENQPPHQHVHIFGAEVNSGSENNGNEAAKEEWRERKEEWKRTQGMTSQSLLPKAAKAAGISYKQLVEKIVN